MSFPNLSFAKSPDSFSGSTKSRSRLRVIRLELPPPDANKNSFGALSPQPILPNAQGYSIGSFPISTTSAIAKGATIISPNIFYVFPENCEPAFVHDVMMPNNAMPFVTQPPPDLHLPRFLIYTVSSTPVSAAPVKFIINGINIPHWVTDPRPMDVTDHLEAFGSKNWLIIESSTIIAPLAVVGVWAEYKTVEEIIQEIEERGIFTFNEFAAICPITGLQIQHPAKGIECQHPQCFDLFPFLTKSMALGKWECPICGKQIPFDQIRIGKKTGQSSFVPLNTQAHQNDLGYVDMI